MGNTENWTGPSVMPKHAVNWDEQQANFECLFHQNSFGVVNALAKLIKMASKNKN